MSFDCLDEFFLTGFTNDPWATYFFMPFFLLLSRLFYCFLDLLVDEFS
jgi:hypothetical protein